MAERVSVTSVPGSNALAIKKTGPSSTARKLVNTKHKRNGSNIQRNRPPTFVSKLWSMINNPANKEYIQWMPDGQSFQVTGREQFEAKILPKYFKHKNFSSFVRQLNMYGWHKVQDISSGSMQNPEEKWQFRSPNFIRGREDLLDNIQRNKGSKESDDEEEVDLSRVLEELEHIRENQLSIGQDLLNIRQDNQLLWDEHLQSQEKYQKQAETLDKIVRFLASLYGSQAKPLTDSHNVSANSRNQLLLMPNPNTSDLPDASDLTTNDSNGTYENGQTKDDDVPYSIPRSKRITSLSSGGSPREIPVDIDGNINVNDTDNNLALSLARKNRQYNPRDLSKTLFPELNNYDMDGAGKSLSPISKQLTLGERIDDNNNKLNNITRDIDSQEMNIQQFQDLIQKMLPGYERDGTEAVPFSTNSPGNTFDTNPTDNIFDMNDFLVDPASADISTTDLGDVANSGGNTPKTNDENGGTQTTEATRTNKKRKVSKR